MEITGIVKEVSGIESGTSKAGKSWHKQTFIMEAGTGEYPKVVALQLWGDKCGSVEVGEAVTAHIDIESREFNGRWFTDVKAWKVDKETPVQAESPFNEGVATEDNDLPF